MATSRSRGCTWITGLFPRRCNLRLVWPKSVLNESYIKPLEVGTVNPDLQTQGEPQTGVGICLKSNYCWTQTEISQTRRPGRHHRPTASQEGTAPVGKASEAGWWPRPFPGPLWPWERHCPLGTRSAGHVWLGSTLKLGSIQHAGRSLGLPGGWESGPLLGHAAEASPRPSAWERG